jgi:hypothetical protein
MVMIAVVTALAMRLPNPRMVAMDFLYGTLAALPLGALYFLVIMPATQQSMLLLCISLAAMAFFIGIEVQKGVWDRWGRWRAPLTFWCWITRCSFSSASSSIVRWGRSSAVSWR